MTQTTANTAIIENVTAPDIVTKTLAEIIVDKNGLIKSHFMVLWLISATLLYTLSM